MVLPSDDACEPHQCSAQHDKPKGAVVAGTHHGKQQLPKWA